MIRIRVPINQPVFHGMSRTWVLITAHSCGVCVRYHVFSFVSQMFSLGSLWLDSFWNVVSLGFVLMVIFQKDISTHGRSPFFTTIWDF